MRHSVILAAAAISLFCLGITSTTAKTAKTVTTHALPKAGVVTLRGTVEKINDPQEFILRDNSGTVAVKLADESAILNEGDSVSITGAVKNQDVYARSVTIDARSGA